MLILSVDTGTRRGSLALLRREVLLGHVTTPVDEPYSVSLSPMLDVLLKAAGVTLGEIDLFAVAAGPGSFTGLRIGLTAVKAWGEAFGKPVAAVSGLEAIAAQTLSSGGSPSGIVLASVLDARRGQVFGGMYRQDSDCLGLLRPVIEELVVSAAEFVELVDQHSGGAAATFVSPTPEVIRAALDQSALRNCDVQEVSGVLAPTVGLLGYRKALRGDLVDALQLDANYVRRSDAELRWKE